MDLIQHVTGIAVVENRWVQCKVYALIGEMLLRNEPMANHLRRDFIWRSLKDVCEAEQLKQEMMTIQAGVNSLGI